MIQRSRSFFVPYCCIGHQSPYKEVIYDSAQAETSQGCNSAMRSSELANETLEAAGDPFRDVGRICVFQFAHLVARPYIPARRTP
jgi:hypothetical protein